jgi:non-heme chloroperoxidase
MDHYADDLAALTAHLVLKDAIHVGYSTGGEVVHYLARHGESRVAKAAIISAVPPLMVKTSANPTGQPKEVFDGLQAQLAANRAQSITMCPLDRSMVTTGPVRNPLRESSGIGGAKG